ncbi:VOC family protein [Draconibacterium sediminis]|uniref:Glyoxalase n=2 Tax=Draconibacterium TaxID=1471399 RepID=A0A0D8JEF1_9BACT|nr:VOC family protein [Draconibacterium sediminis]KJF45189.1 glyoxalase [Draconibacterium sediminis]
MKKSLFSLALVLFTFFAMAQNNFSKSAIGVGVVVEDLEKSIDFYTNVIGMVKTGEFSVSKEQCTELGLTDSYQLDVTILKLEDSEEASEWKLMSLGTKAKHPKQKFMSDDTGMQYITIMVKHLQPVLDRIEKQGIKVLSGKPSELGENRFFLLVQDPDGTFIELIGPK